MQLSGRMCCCSLVLCAPHCGVIMNHYNVIIWAAVVFALLLLIVVKKLWYVRQQIVAVLPSVLWQHLTLAAVQLHILRFVLADRNKEVVVVFVITGTWVGIVRLQKWLWCSNFYIKFCNRYLGIVEFQVSDSKTCVCKILSVLYFSLNASFLSHHISLFNLFSPLKCVHLPFVLPKVSSWKRENLILYIYKPKYSTLT